MVAGPEAVKYMRGVKRTAEELPSSIFETAIKD